MRIISYDGTKEEKERIEAEQVEEGYMLVEIQNIVEGNFLGFVDKDGYDPAPPPTPEATRLQKLEKRAMELEGRTKLLEYNVQTTGETLDIHEGAIVDVMNLALGGSLREA